MELEAKFRVPDTENIELQLDQEGYEVEANKHQIDHYYIVGKTDDDGTRHYLRLRNDERTGERSLDYHRVLSELETDEKELTIDSIDDAKGILELLGHEVECVVDKERTEYANDEVLITVDHIDTLGDFVEIEMEGERTELTEQRFETLIDRFELDANQRVTQKGYPELIIQKDG